MIPNAMTSHPSETSGRARRQGGFSLIELMIAITLGLLILTGMTAVFVNTSATRNEIDRTNRQIENGRYAIELLRDDIQLAGFYGELDIAGVATAFSLTTPIAIPLPDLCATALLERTDPASPANGSPGLLQVHVQGVNNYVAGGLACLGANVVKPGTDVIVVRRAKTCVAGVGDCDTLNYLAGLADASHPVADGIQKPVLQISFCPTPTVPSTSTISTHALALYPNAGEFVHLNNIAAGSPPGTACTVAAQLRPYVIYLYFVGTDDVLKRAEFINGVGMGNVTPLVSGIENMQLDYGVDNVGTRDGNADSYTASPATVTDWSDVVAVQINLLVRNTEASPDPITKTYNLGPSAGSVTFTDNFRRHVYSARVRIQNISGRREVP